MTAFRLAHGGDWIDRETEIRFRFDGCSYAGFAGDTLAAALLANGVGVVSRSFKYHRPRGIWGGGVEEPNAIVDIRQDGLRSPNARATLVPLRPGLEAVSVNADPDAAHDRLGFIDRFARFLPAGFYYKTFMWPDWHLYEPRIRRMAGLGEADPAWRSARAADRRHAHCDLLVIGGGPAGLLAARIGAAKGQRVLLVESERRCGGSLRHRAGGIDGKAAAAWIDETVTLLRAGGHRVLCGATAFGIYDHNLVGICQQHEDGRPDTLWRVRAGHVAVAAGALERPLPFANNDLPGVMSADAALRYRVGHGIVPGRRVVVATNNDSAYEVAALLASDADVTLIDSRAEGGPGIAGLHARRGVLVAGAIGDSGVRAVQLSSGERLQADSLLVSGGWTPSVHLFCQARGKLHWSDAAQALLPAAPVDGVSVVGAARDGLMPLGKLFGAVAEAMNAPDGSAETTGAVSTGPEAACGVGAFWPFLGSQGRIWIDLQNDVTAKDVALAVRENYVSVEHLKRYTTLGMATDQGKTSNVAGLAALSEITGQPIGALGTTTYRPPFAPVPLATMVGLQGGELLNPIRRLPLEAQHRAAGAIFQEYGGWLRPAYYGAADAQAAIQAEARKARESVALFDGSPLGKIEVFGPKAAEFMDFIYYNTMSSLAPGRCRYGFMLSETGVVFDDGVLIRLAENHFIVSCSSGHVGAVRMRLEEWRQDRFGRDAVFIHDATAALATLTVSGPQARPLLQRAGLEIALDDEALPHMTVAAGRFDGAPIRVARISFTGDRSYEISIAVERADGLWRRLREAGQAFSAGLLGIEALMLLRMEKGYVVIGRDTDGTTMPHDLGMPGPRNNRKAEFVGRRSLFTEAANAGNRLNLVGLQVAAGEAPLPVGAHGVAMQDGRPRSIGFVTSSGSSPILQRPVALALIEAGATRIGETITLRHLGEMRQAVIAPACAFDPVGDRLHA